MIKHSVLDFIMRVLVFNRYTLFVTSNVELDRTRTEFAQNQFSEKGQIHRVLLAKKKASMKAPIRILQQCLPKNPHVFY